MVHSFLTSSSVKIMLHTICIDIVSIFYHLREPASWLSSNEFVFGMGVLRFKSQAGQIGHSVRHRCDISSKETVLLVSAMTQRLPPATCYTLWRNIASTV